MWENKGFAGGGVEEPRVSDKEEAGSATRAHCWWRRWARRSGARGLGGATGERGRREGLRARRDRQRPTPAARATAVGQQLPREELITHEHDL